MGNITTVFIGWCGQFEVSMISESQSLRGFKFELLFSINMLHLEYRAKTD